MPLQYLNPPIYVSPIKQQQQQRRRRQQQEEEDILENGYNTFAVCAMSQPSHLGIAYKTTTTATTSTTTIKATKHSEDRFKRLCCLSPFINH